MAYLYHTCALSIVVWWQACGLSSSYLLHIGLGYHPCASSQLCLPPTIRVFFYDIHLVSCNRTFIHNIEVYPYTQYKCNTQICQDWDSSPQRTFSIPSNIDTKRQHLYCGLSHHRHFTIWKHHVKNNIYKVLGMKNVFKNIPNTWSWRKHNIYKAF